MGSFRSVKKAGMVAAVLLLLTLSLGGAVASKSNDQAATYENLRLFTEVLSIIQEQYVDESRPRTDLQRHQGDPPRSRPRTASFLDPEMYREMQVEDVGSFGGLGIEITLRDDILTVVTPIEGTPLPGGHPAGRPHREDRGDLDQGHAAGRRGSRRCGQAGKQDRHRRHPRGMAGAERLTITREQIRVQSVKSGELEPGIEYIRLRQFQEQTGNDIETALEKYTRPSPSRGSCSTCAQSGRAPHLVRRGRGEVLEPGKLVVYTEGRVRNQNMRFQASGKHTYSDFPIVVLVTRAARRRPRSWPVRSRTGARGRAGYAELRQGLRADDHSAVGRLWPASTTAKYYTPKGRSIHGQGHLAGHRGRGPKPVAPRRARAAPSAAGR